MPEHVRNVWIPYPDSITNYVYMYMWNKTETKAKIQLRHICCVNAWYHIVIQFGSCAAAFFPPWRSSSSHALWRKYWIIQFCGHFLIKNWVRDVHDYPPPYDATLFTFGETLTFASSAMKCLGCSPSNNWDRFSRMYIFQTQRPSILSYTHAIDDDGEHNTMCSTLQLPSNVKILIYCWEMSRRTNSSLKSLSHAPSASSIGRACKPIRACHMRSSHTPTALQPSIGPACRLLCIILNF